MRQGTRITAVMAMRRLLVILAVAGFCGSVSAHRAPGSLTTIEWNAASGQTEVAHRLHSHDAEFGIASILGLSKFSITDIEARARAALYVESRFHIRRGEQDLALNLVGAELVGQYLFVYQEIPQQLDGKISVRNDILRDVYPAQINQVNIKDGSAVHTLTFAGEEGWLDYEFRHLQGDIPSR